MLSKINKATLVFAIYWVVTIIASLLLSKSQIIERFPSFETTLVLFEKVWLFLGLVLFLTTTFISLSKERKLKYEVERLEASTKEIKAKLYDRRESSEQIKSIEGN